MKTFSASAIVIAAVVAALLSAGRLSWSEPSIDLVDRSGKTIDTSGWRAVSRTGSVAGWKTLRHSPYEEEERAVTGRRLWILRVRAGPGRRLTGDGSGMVENTMPLWSPDGIASCLVLLRHGKAGSIRSARMARAPRNAHRVGNLESPDELVAGRPVNSCTGFRNVQWILPLTGDRKPVQLPQVQRRTLRFRGR